MNERISGNSGLGASVYANSQNESPSNRESIETTLDRISHSMSFDPTLFTQDPVGGSWDTISDYVGAISYNQEQEQDFFSWKGLDLADIDLNEPANPEDALAGLLKTAAALKVEIPYTDGRPLDKDTLGEPWQEIQDRITLEERSSMRLGDLILDIYPGLQSGIEEITQQLELAANDPEEFKRQFNQQEGDSRVVLHILCKPFFHF